MSSAGLKGLLAAGLATALLAAGAGCSQDDDSEVGKGARLMLDPTVSTAVYNAVSCGYCHDVRPVVASPDNPGFIFSGFSLFNAYYRTSFWGGYELNLLDAINVCVTDFMRGKALTADDPKAQQLLAYIEAISPGQDTTSDDGKMLASAQPLTFVRDVNSVSMNGDKTRGKLVYKRACQPCHGDIHTGENRLNCLNTKVPDDSVALAYQLIDSKGCPAADANHPTADEVKACTLTVVAEKTRHGRYFGIGGNMPPFSTEVMSDAQIDDLVAYVGDYVDPNAPPAQPCDLPAPAKEGQ
jgi:thiosulfate dehydrogenase